VRAFGTGERIVFLEYTFSGAARADYDEAALV
jgi:hypothetical protein